MKGKFVLGGGIFSAGTEAGVNDLSHSECSREGNAGFVRAQKNLLFSVVTPLSHLSDTDCTTGDFRLLLAGIDALLRNKSLII